MKLSTKKKVLYTFLTTPFASNKKLLCSRHFPSLPLANKKKAGEDTRNRRKV